MQAIFKSNKESLLKVCLCAVVSQIALLCCFLICTTAKLTVQGLLVLLTQQESMFQGHNRDIQTTKLTRALVSVMASLHHVISICMSGSVICVSRWSMHICVACEWQVGAILGRGSGAVHNNTTNNNRTAGWPAPLLALFLLGMHPVFYFPFQITNQMSCSISSPSLQHLNQGTTLHLESFSSASRLLTTGVVRGHNSSQQASLLAPTLALTSAHFHIFAYIHQRPQVVSCVEMAQAGTFRTSKQSVREADLEKNWNGPNCFWHCIVTVSFLSSKQRKTFLCVTQRKPYFSFESEIREKLCQYFSYLRNPDPLKLCHVFLECRLLVSDDNFPFLPVATWLGCFIP